MDSSFHLFDDGNNSDNLSNDIFEMKDNCFNNEENGLSSLFGSHDDIDQNQYGFFSTDQS
jgi:hypothetical protein